jgi:uncharacterized phiE125 gp8 family phage protein
MRRVATIVTAPADTPVSLAEVKAHCRVSFSDDDTIMAIYIASAVASVEQFLQRKLINQTWKMFLDYWPQKIETQFGTLQSVTHVKYTDVYGTAATFFASSYTVDTASVPGRIVLKDGESWPSVTLNEVNPIEVQFVSGYGATSASVPQDIRNAVLMTAAHLYENREPVIVGDMRTVEPIEVPWTFKALLAPHRVPRWCV